MKKIMVIGSIVLALFVAGMLYFGSAHSAKKDSPYQFAEITRGDLENIISSTGTLHAVGTIEIGTQVSGTIDRVDVDFNDTVHKGQVLAVLDTALLKIAVLDAEANVARAQAQYEQAQAEYDRNLPLFEKGYLSEREFLPIQISVKTNLAAVQSAQAALARAQTHVEYAIIRSPIDGAVIQRNVEPGQTVAASLSAPTLFLIAEDLSYMEIYATVDESDIGQIQEGQSVRFTVEAYPEETFYGTVCQIRLQPTTIQNVVNYTVIVEVSNRDDLLLPGMTAMVDFVIEQRTDVLLVSNTALRFQPTQEMVVELREDMQERLKEAADSPNRRAPRSGEFGGGKRMSWPSQSGAESDMGQLWILDEQGKLGVVPVRKGATDGVMTEIAEIRSDKGETEEGIGKIAMFGAPVSLGEGTQVISGATQQKEQGTSTNGKSLLPTPGPGGRRF